MFKLQKAKHRQHQLKILYLVKLYFKSEGKLKTFADKQILENLSPAYLPAMNVKKKFFKEREMR